LETAIITRGPALINLDIESVKSLSQAFKQSGLFPDIQSEAQAIVKIIAGQELNVPPVYAMQNFFIIKGKLTMSAQVMGLLLKRTGKYDYRVKEHSDQKCVIEFYQDGALVYTSTFTITDATRAGVNQPNSNWAKYPKAMLFARALSSGGRIVAPELLSGAYTSEELESALEDAPPMPEPREKAMPKSKTRKKEEATEEATQEVTEEVIEAVLQAAVPTVSTREATTVKSLPDMYKACFEDFSLQPAEIMKELGVKANSEITKTPWECYLQIAGAFAPDLGEKE
jgi:hypothetical protein